ncbi:hypothetical protein FL865_14210 [Listeria monocytogenes]|nr:hypothetical protein [Listeria monocytogenes]
MKRRIILGLLLVCLLSVTVGGYVYTNGTNRISANENNSTFVSTEVKTNKDIGGKLTPALNPEPASTRKTQQRAIGIPYVPDNITSVTTAWQYHGISEQVLNGEGGYGVPWNSFDITPTSFRFEYIMLTYNYQQRHYVTAQGTHIYLDEQLGRVNNNTGSIMAVRKTGFAAMEIMTRRREFLELLSAYPHAHSAQGPIFERWAYRITWNGNGRDGGIQPADTDQIEGNPLNWSGTPTRTGHTFNGWYSQYGHEYKSGQSYMSPGALNLTARWTRNNYTQSFNGNGHTGGTVPGSRSVAYDYTSTVPAAPTKTGHTFAGWFSTSAATGGTQLTTSYKQAAGNVTWYARWTRNNYTQGFHGNGNTGGTTPARTVAYDATSTVPAGPTKTGFSFVGWFNTIADTGGTQLTTSYRQPAYNVTWYARWRRNYYTQWFNGNGHTGGTVPGGRNVAYEATSTVPAGPTRTGYTFVGWFGGANGASGAQLTTSFKQLAYDITWTARWQANTYTESFYRSKVVPNTAGYNDHTKPTNKWLESLTSLTRTVTFDQTYSAPVYTTPPGYTFLGWYEDIGTIADASGAKIGEQFPATPYAFGKFTNAGNKAIHYLLKPNKYALTLDFNGNGTGPRTQDVYYDSEYNINGSFPYPKRIGYIFEGWHTAATGGTKVTDTELYTATSDTTLYAQWTKDPYAIRKTDDPTEDIEIDETKDNAVILSGNKNELRIDYVPSYDFRLDKKKNEEDVQYPNLKQGSITDVDPDQNPWGAPSTVTEAIKDSTGQGTEMNYGLQVTDVRPVKTPWDLTVEMTKPFTHTQNSTRLLDGAQINLPSWESLNDVDSSVVKIGKLELSYGTGSVLASDSSVMNFTAGIHTFRNNVTKSDEQVSLVVPGNQNWQNTGTQSEYQAELTYTFSVIP